MQESTINDAAAAASSTVDEVDSRDPPAAIEPLHILPPSLPPPVRESSSASAENAKMLVLRRPTVVTPRKNKLTLSAFRRPEQTVRLTDSDRSRLLENEYDLRSSVCRVLGHGAFSTVRLAVRLRDGTKVAVKSIAKHDALRARRLRRSRSPTAAGASPPPSTSSCSSSSSRHLDEWEILARLKDCPYVIQLLDIFETDEEIHLITEYCAGGELYNVIQGKGNSRTSFRRGRFTEAQASKIARQILRALADMHSQNIIHRDVKVENILLVNRSSVLDQDSDGNIQVKLCDFGMARLQQCQHEQGQTSSGGATPVGSSSKGTGTASSSDGEASPNSPILAYTTNSAPELCHGPSSCRGPPVDVYSMGVTLYILLCGYSPVFLDEVVVFPEAYWHDISERAKTLIRKMLHPEPEQRITAKQALEDPWIVRQSKPSTRYSRRGSIGASLELVRARLYQYSASSENQNGNSVRPTTTAATSMSYKRRPSGFSKVLSPGKKRRRSSTAGTPSSTSFALALADLYQQVNAGEK